MNLTRLLHLGNLVRQSRLPQLHARPGFVDQIDGLVRQEAVGNISAREVHRVLDGLFGVADGVKLFVTLAHALQHQNGFLFVGRAHFHGLEAAFQRAIALHGLAIFARCGGANALNFAAAQRRLQDVGGVQRTFRRTRAHQGVQFVDENDGALALHQFLHDGLQALFKLSAVLGARNDQRKIQRQDALVGQKRRHIAIRDALRQAFDDGRLAHTRFADQYRIVLGAAAEDLNDALHFLVASHERIQLAFQRRLRQIATEFGQ